MFKVTLIGWDVLDPTKPSVQADEYDSEYHDIGSLLQDLFEPIQDWGHASFYVSGFGQDPWPVDIGTDLVIFCEQLPALAGWINGGATGPFTLDLYEQGIERLLTFAKQESAVQIVCESRSHWQPFPDTESVAHNELAMQLNAIRHSIGHAAKRVAPGVFRHPWFQDWLAATEVTAAGLE